MIINTSTGAVTFTQPTATNYVIGTLSATGLAAGATATFTVSGANSAKATIRAQFTVTDPAGNGPDGDDFTPGGGWGN